jgi:hypothetical protein
MPSAQEPKPDAHCPFCKEPVAYEPHWSGLMRFHVLGDGTLRFLCPENQPNILKEMAS